MRMGTKSLLFGAHQFILHPIFVAYAWWRLYGFPKDPRLWVAFIVHDWGYWGKKAMDDAEGETHPILGARIMARLFGPDWGEFTLLHSRWFAKRLGKQYSKLCIADKMAIVVQPSWTYLPLVWLTGELKEYMHMNREARYREMGYDHSSSLAWHRSVKRYIDAWVQEHKDVDRPDSWMTGNGCAITEPPTVNLPGYLEGGYIPDKYIILKRDGTPIDPKAKYMVLRYDKDRDPHAITSILMYACCVQRENPELASDIFDALQEELGLSLHQFSEKYTHILIQMDVIAQSVPN